MKRKTNKSLEAILFPILWIIMVSCFHYGFGLEIIWSGFLGFVLVFFLWLFWVWVRENFF